MQSMTDYFRNDVLEKRPYIRMDVVPGRSTEPGAARGAARGRAHPALGVGWRDRALFARGHAARRCDAP